MKTQHIIPVNTTLQASNKTSRGISKGTAVLSPKTANKDKRKTSLTNEAVTRSVPTLTHKMIAERARAIWLERGCPSGRDDLNWQEAEAQLRRELGLVR